MKTKKLIIVLSVLISTLIIISTDSCSKGEEKTNKPPTCTITSPASGQEITKGETITISVEAQDDDGSITEVRFFIDNVGKGSATSFPFNYNWNTDNENLGNHTLKATSFDNDGGSTSDEITVTIIESSGNVPVANFSSNITSGTAPLSINFTDQSTNNPTGWQWTFGDGGTNTQQNPSHTYNTDGSYTVTLTVTNSSGSDTESKIDYIIVSGGSNTPPTALFTVSPSNGTTSTNFAFDASGSTDNEDPTSNLQVRWDFDGDGSWDTGWNTVKTINHQYGSESTYAAKLEVKDTEGLINQYTKSITVSNGGGGEPCPGTPTVTDADGNVYNTVQIGNQCWMAENLNYETTNSWWYENSSAYGDVYGRLYTWEAALTACPSGWSLPNHDEWTILTTYLGGEDVAGGKMKETGTTHWNSPNTGATNSSGFTALPGGNRSSSGSFGYLVNYGNWWSSSTGTSGTAAVNRNLNYYDGQVSWGYYSKTKGFSVRCLKD